MEKAERARRHRERITVVILLGVLVALALFEVHVLRLSAKLPFVNSLFFFGLMNLNIVLIMLLLFLVFRNVVKLILDEKRGKIGARLKSRLVFSLVLFAMIPTVLLFAISAMYIKSSFDKWFSAKVESTLQRSIEVVKIYYDNTERSAQHFARRIASTLDGPSKVTLAKMLDQARLEYGIDAVEFYASPFTPRVLSVSQDKVDLIPACSIESLREVFSGKNRCRIQNIGTGELVRCGIAMGPGKGALFVNTLIPLSLASQLSEVSMTYEDFRKNNPLDYPLKSTYFAILSMVTLLILFAAIWTGFYIAKRLTVPIEDLLKGTEAVAKGRLDFQLPSGGQGELSKLVDSFNSMVHDLHQNKLALEKSHMDLQQINEELGTRRRYLSVLLENLQSGVISLDEGGRITMVNAAASRLLSVSPNELVMKPYWSIIPESYRREIREALAAIATTGNTIRKEIKLDQGKGAGIALLVTMSALRDENRRQRGIVAVIDDVTEMQKIERMSAWREVARRMAHEIKNPLTPIQLAVERLRRRYLDKIRDDGTFDEATQIVLKEVDSLKSLVSEFTTYARLPELVKAPADLNTFAMEVATLFRTAHEKIHVEIDLWEGLPTLNLDKAQMKRALINLMDNAVAASGGVGVVRLSTSQNEALKVFSLSVSDQGSGIAEEASQQLFEPYFSTKEGGTGLGLAIVQRIIGDHGGCVRVSKNFPTGTTFTIELPWLLKTDGVNTNAKRFDPQGLRDSMPVEECH